ncbi:MAG: nucleotidyltransferase domain-containing protein [Phycisphaerae bacterium]|nr:nucleotidyltransferase domain-containing protein [Phycisphaerae bacterium]
MSSKIMNFDVEQLAAVLETACPEAIFALLHGSAKDGRVGPGSDIDIALYLEGESNLDLYRRAQEAVDSVCSEAEADIGILNRAEPVYRFEALRGRLLFCRDRETYLTFFTRTSREYELQMADYERQRNYRLAAARNKA